MKTTSSTKSGFTLVELLAVVAIIAVLAAVVVNSIGNTTQAAQTASAKRQVQVLNSAYQSYVAAGGVQQDSLGNAVTALQDTDLTTPSGIKGPFLLDEPITSPIAYTAANGTHISDGAIVFADHKFSLNPPAFTQGGTTGGATGADE